MNLRQGVESLEDVLVSLNNQWTNVQDVWCDESRAGFECFFGEIETDLKRILDDLQRVVDAVERAGSSLE